MCLHFITEFSPDFSHLLTVRSCVFVCVRALGGGQFTLLGGMLSVFLIGTIIPESKLRRVHGWLEMS